jgi:hypothetical protein
MVRHEETCDRAEQDDLCMFARDDGKRTRGRKETLGTHVTCSSNAAGASLQAVKNEKTSRTATNQRSQRRPRQAAMARSGRFPRKSELAPHTHGSDSG